jgi:hypothetical protein
MELMVEVYIKRFERCVQLCICTFAEFQPQVQTNFAKTVDVAPHLPRAKFEDDRNEIPVQLLEARF